MFKKIISLSIAALLSLSLVCTPAFADNIFPDVGKNNYAWAADAIEDMVQLGIIKGYTDGTFKPERSITKTEALVLSSRILGYTNSINSDFVNYATHLYSDILETYETSYSGEISYLLYKNVLKESDLPYYIGGENSSAPLKRYEAAVLLTKVMGAEDSISSVNASSTPYTDSSDIPATAKAYVNYVTDVGLMNGMNVSGGVNEFAPLYEVNRAQMSMLLYRIMNTLDQQITVTTFKSYDSSSKTIYVVSDDGTASTIAVSFLEDPIVKKDGFISSLDKISAFSRLAVIKRDGAIYAIEALSDDANGIVEGVLSATASSTSGNKITIYNLENTEDVKSYTLAATVAIVRDGNTATFKDLVRSDYLKITVTNGEVTRIEAAAKDVTIKGTVQSISLSPVFEFVLLLTDGTSTSYETDSNLTVKRNGKTATLKDILVGDNVSATIRYGKLFSITATSINTSYSGTINEITIATMPSIKIANGSVIAEYSISRDAQYLIDGVSGTIYDLRLNANITVTIESDTIVKVVASTPASNSVVTGAISTINSQYGFFILSNTEADGSITNTQVFFNPTTTIINSETGKSMLSSKLVVGSKVSITGAMNAGAFEATTIIYIP